MDVKKAFGPGSWWSICRDIERGNHPDPTDIAEALWHSDLIPQVVREYIAGLIDGSVKRSVGRPPLPAFERMKLQDVNRSRRAAQFAFARRQESVYQCYGPRAIRVNRQLGPQAQASNALSLPSLRGGRVPRWSGFASRSRR